LLRISITDCYISQEIYIFMETREMFENLDGNALYFL
jgi:hypothetical protein